MAGLTFIARYHDPAAELQPYCRWNRSTHFVAPNWNVARIEADSMTRVGETLILLEISEPQRLLDPELDASKMRPDDPIFGLTWADVVEAGEYGGLDGQHLASDLNADEMRVFLRCVESGLSCWKEVVQLALAAATSERE